MPRNKRYDQATSEGFSKFLTIKAPNAHKVPAKRTNNISELCFSNFI